jgi:hypothetical protein
MCGGRWMSGARDGGATCASDWPKVLATIITSHYITLHHISHELPIFTSKHSDQQATDTTMTESTTRVELSLSISPSTHSFTNPLPPTITMTLLSYASHPITFFTWNTPLHIQHILSNNGIIITDLTTNTAVKLSRIMIQRIAIKRIKGSHDEVLFPTLEPGVPATFSRAFGRNATVKPLPKEMIKNGWERDDEGNEIKIRRPSTATGVDGLEAGHSYRVGVNMELLELCKWASATRDEVLVDPDAIKSNPGVIPSDVDSFPWEKERKIEWIVHEAVLDVME